MKGKSKPKTKNLKPKTSFLRNIFSMAFFTQLSRVFGLIRTIIFARLLGTGAVSDIFLITYQFPNLFRRMFAEGAMSAGFVPVYSELSEKEKKRNKKESIEFFHKILTLVLFFISALVLLGVILAPLIIKGYYLLDDKGITPEALSMGPVLFRIMFPYLLFISLAAILQGVLNSHNRFAVPAVTPVFFNIIIISAALLYYKYGAADSAEAKTFYLAAGVITGGFIQAAFQLPFVMKLGIPIRLNWSLVDKNVKRFITLILPVIFSTSIYQINIILSNVIALDITKGAVSALFYSHRLQEYPLGIIVVSISTVILTRFSRELAKKDNKSAHNSLQEAIRLLYLLLMPVILYTVILNREIVSLVFLGDEFTEASRLMTSRCLYYHIISIMAVGYTRIFQPLFYAMKDTRTPFKAAVFTMVTNLLLCLLLTKVFEMDAEGIALASLISMTLMAIVLYIYLLKKYPFHIGRISLKSAGITTASLLLSGTLLYLFSSWFSFENMGHIIPPSFSTINRMRIFFGVKLVAAFVMMMATYLPFLLAFKVKEAEKILVLLRIRKR